jgi:hypothetical protein
MTVEKPLETAHVWFVNAVDYFAVDIFVNGGDEPEITDAKPLEIGPIFEVDGSPAAPFQTYAFQVRQKGDPRGPVLAEASVELRRRQSFTAVFHFGDASFSYGLSIFANDFTPSGNTRLEMRHVGFVPRVDWSLVPKPEADPRIEVDNRSGSLARGQWQQATEVIENDYLLEVRADGRLLAFHPDLEQEHEKMLAVYFAGHPLPERMERSELRRFLLVQEFKLPLGPPLGPRTTEPAGPYADRNLNQPVVFDGAAIEVFQTNRAKGEVRATDPDGFVTALALDRVVPDAGAVEIPDGGVTPSKRLGGPARAAICVGPDTPVGEYQVTVRTNPQSLAESAVYTLPVTVKPITVQRLRDRIDDFWLIDAIDAVFASELHNLLTDVDAALAGEQCAQAGTLLGTFSDRVEARTGSDIRTPAADALRREAAAFREHLDAGRGAETSPCLA